MAWSNNQKQIAARGCKAAGISDEQRKDMILRHFDHARMPDGRISSTAPKLNNLDYEQFMAVVESHAGGKILHFTVNYWRNCAADGLSRLRHRAQWIADELEAAGKLARGGVGLAGWISKRVANAATDRLEGLDYPGLMALVVGLQCYARREKRSATGGTAGLAGDERCESESLNDTHITPAMASGCSACHPALHGSLP